MVRKVRKRLLLDGEDGQPSKRRRLGQASILCMRELFRAMVRDGDISDDDRLCLQNVAVLLSQVDGNTWVNFAESNGELRDLSPQQLRRLRPFLDTVAEELKKKEAELISNDASGSCESLDCLKLVEVPWADGITARELLTCCGPDQELQLSRGLWLQRATQVLPSKYMLRSRVRELINYYYLKRIDMFASSPSSESSRSLLQRAEDAKVPGVFIVSAFIRVSWDIVSRIAVFVVTCLRWCRALASLAMLPVSSAVFAAATLAIACAHAVAAAMPVTREPLWPAVRLFSFAFVYGQVQKLCQLLVLIARLRVILCLAGSNEIVGLILYPFVLIARVLLRWNEGSFILGCSCDEGTLSLLSWLPVRTSDNIAWLLTQLVCGLTLFPYAVSLKDPLVRAVDFLHPIISFTLDLLFSIGIAEGLAMVIRQADDHIKAKLVWMSMNVGRMLREGSPNEPNTPTPEQDAQGGNTAGGHADAETAQVGAAETSTGDDVLMQSADVASSLPEWNEQGTWSVFD